MSVQYLISTGGPTSQLVKHNPNLIWLLIIADRIIAKGNATSLFDILNTKFHVLGNGLCMPALLSQDQSIHSEACSSKEYRQSKLLSHIGEAGGIGSPVNGVPLGYNRAIRLSAQTIALYDLIAIIQFEIHLP